MRGNYDKKTGGFTLIEIIMVLVILGVLSIVAAPNMLNMPPLRLDMAARKMQADIRYAQSLATSTQRWTGVFFNAASDNYTVYIDGAGASPGGWTAVTDPLSRQNLTVQLNNAEFTGVDITLAQFNQPEEALVFDKWGNPYGYDSGSGTVTALGSSGRVTLTAGSGTTDVRVERGTGRVYLQ